MKILKLDFKLFKGVIIKKHLIITLLFLSTFLSVFGQNNQEKSANIKITFNASDKIDCHEITDEHRSKFCKKINSKGKIETTTSIVDIPFDTPLKLMAFSASFKSHGSHSHDIVMYYSVLNESLGWTEWLSLSEDMHDYNEETYSTNLAFIRRGDTKIRFKIAGIDMDKSNFEVFFINLPKRDESDKFLIEDNHQKNGACPKPSVLGRLSYLSSSENSNHGTPVYTTVTHTVVHHADWSTSTANPTWRDIAYSVWKLHRISKGWSDIAYNYLIDPDGNIYEGRAGGDNVRGVALCGSHNNLMAVCMLGDFHQTNQFLTNASRDKLVDILSWKIDKENINPLGSSSLNNYGNQKHIMGHRDGCSTSCPGDNIYNVLGDIRTRVANNIDGGCSGGGGGSCPPTVSLSGAVSGTHKAANSISSTGRVSSGTVTFRSPVIYLNNGFTVSGGTFNAQNAACSGNKEENEQAFYDFSIQPNPFGNATQIKFTLSEALPVTIWVTDMMGRHISTLANDEITSAGEHQVTFEAANYSAGMYFATIQAGEYFGTQKMILAK